MTPMSVSIFADNFLGKAHGIPLGESLEWLGAQPERLASDRRTRNIGPVWLTNCQRRTPDHHFRFHRHTQQNHSNSVLLQSARGAPSVAPKVFRAATDGADGSTTIFVY